MTKCQKDPAYGIFMKRWLTKVIKNVFLKSRCHILTVILFSCILRRLLFLHWLSWLCRFQPILTKQGVPENTARIVNAVLKTNLLWGHNFLGPNWENKMNCHKVTNIEGLKCESGQSGQLGQSGQSGQSGQLTFVFLSSHQRHVSSKVVS